jgi:hypothetical protein
MRIRAVAVLSTILGGVLACTGAQAQMAVPKSHGTTLSGAAVSFPDALKGKFGVLVVGFSHASQEQVASWGRLLEADYGQSPKVTYFEIPMLAGAPKLLRGMIVKSMTKSVPGPERPHFLPMTEGEPAWRAVAHYNKPDDAYVMIVDENGTVRWQTEGEATDAAYADFKKNLATVMAQIVVP